MIIDAQNPIVGNDVVLHPRTDDIIVTIPRPTTLNPVNWPNTVTIRVSIIVTVDGEEYRCVGQATGGIRVGTDGSEMAEYRLIFRPTIFLENGSIKRLGEHARNAYRGHYLLELISGSSADIEPSFVTRADTRSNQPNVVRGAA